LFCQSSYNDFEMGDESQKSQAVVLLSGGMDSCVSAAIARERHGAGNIALLHAGYGQRTEERERRAFEGIADFYAVSRGQRLVVRLDHFRAIGGSALTDRKIAVPENELGRAGPEGSSIPVTYVPFRNAHFLSVAVSWAEAIGAEAVTLGRWRRIVLGIPIAARSITRCFRSWCAWERGPRRTSKSGRR
jgi:7-cyano-7-deazaguanine synthase